MLDHKHPASISTLVLDNKKIPSIESLEVYKNSLADYTSVYHLSLINCGLSSLASFPDLPELQKVEFIFYLLMKLNECCFVLLSLILDSA